MVCSNCKNNMLDGFKFCHHCGKPAALSVNTGTVEAEEAVEAAESAVLPEEKVSADDVSAFMPPPAEVTAPVAEKAKPVETLPEEPPPAPSVPFEAPVLVALREEEPQREPAPPETAKFTAPLEPKPIIKEAPPYERPPVFLEEQTAKKKEKEIFSVGKMFFLELICYIPVLNFIILAGLAMSGRKPWRSRLAQAKILAMVTVFLILLLSVLALVILMYYDIIPPIYLGRWRL